MTKLLKSFWLWLAAAVVVASVALMVSPATSTRTQRVAHLESIVKCPACDDLSVAQSNATSAVAVRNEIVHLVDAGKSDSSILSTLQNQYGSIVLLSPRAGALGILLWGTPLVVLVIGAAIYARLARRRS